LLDLCLNAPQRPRLSAFFFIMPNHAEANFFPSRPTTAASDAAETSVSLLLSVESRNVFSAASELARPH
jgi:hypothetical protein